MRYFVVISLLLVNTAAINSNTKEVENILQSVLDIREFNKYLNKSPRFISSSRSSVYLLANKFVPRNIDVEVNNIPVKVLDPDLVNIQDYNFFLEVRSLSINQNRSSIELYYKNSRLLQEERKKLHLTAELKKGNKQNWIIKEYTLEKVSISD